MATEFALFEPHMAYADHATVKRATRTWFARWLAGEWMPGMTEDAA